MAGFTAVEWEAEASVGFMPVGSEVDSPEEDLADFMEAGLMESTLVGSTPVDTTPVALVPKVPARADLASVDSTQADSEVR